MLSLAYFSKAGVVSRGCDADGRADAAVQGRQATMSGVKIDGMSKGLLARFLCAARRPCLLCTVQDVDCQGLESMSGGAPDINLAQAAGATRLSRLVTSCLKLSEFLVSARLQV